MIFKKILIAVSSFCLICFGGCASAAAPVKKALITPFKLPGMGIDSEIRPAAVAPKPAGPSAAAARGEKKSSKFIKKKTAEKQTVSAAQASTQAPFKAGAQTAAKESLTLLAPVAPGVSAMPSAVVAPSAPPSGILAMVAHDEPGAPVMPSPTLAPAMTPGKPSPAKTPTIPEKAAVKKAIPAAKVKESKVQPPVAITTKAPEEHNIAVTPLPALTPEMTNDRSTAVAMPVIPVMAATKKAEPEGKTAVPEVQLPAPVEEKITEEPAIPETKPVENTMESSLSPVIPAEPAVPEMPVVPEKPVVTEQKTEAKTGEAAVELPAPVKETEAVQPINTEAKPIENITVNPPATTVPAEAVQLSVEPGIVKPETPITAQKDVIKRAAEQKAAEPPAKETVEKEQAAPVPETTEKQPQQNTAQTQPVPETPKKEATLLKENGMEPAPRPETAPVKAVETPGEAAGEAPAQEPVKEVQKEAVRETVAPKLEALPKPSHKFDKQEWKEKARARKQQLKEDAEPQEASRMHTVVRGDNLESLAEKYYGDKSQWVKLFEANRDKIEKGSLEAGQVILIP